MVEKIDDSGYWNRYYNQGVCKTYPSNFAKFVMQYCGAPGPLLELGCGNGRDALFFHREGLKVDAIDYSEIAITNLKKFSDEMLSFYHGDFIDYVKEKMEEYKYIYSRFTLHAINKAQADCLLQCVHQALVADGLFFIEARSIHDPLFSKGEAKGDNAFVYNGHYRRFLELDKLQNDLKRIGFCIIYAQESTGFAPFENADPPIIRVIAKKIM